MNTVPWYSYTRKDLHDEKHSCCTNLHFLSSRYFVSGRAMNWAFLTVRPRHHDLVAGPLKTIHSPCFRFLNFLSTRVLTRTKVAYLPVRQVGNNKIGVDGVGGKAQYKDVLFSVPTLTPLFQTPNRCCQSVVADMFMTRDSTVHNLHRN